MLSQVLPIPRGFRALSPDELAQVAGGTQESRVGEIVVTGVRYQSDLNSFSLAMHYTQDGTWNVHYTEFDMSEVTNPGPEVPRNENGFTEEEENSVLDQLKAMEAALKEIVDNGRGDSIIVLPNGSEYTVSELVEGMGRAIEAIDAGVLLYELSQGDATIGDVASFIGGALFGGALVAAGVSPIGVFIAAGVFGAGLGALTDDYLESLGDSLRDAFNLAAEQIHTNEPPMTFNEWLSQMLLRWFTIDTGSGGVYYPEYPNPTGPTYNEP